jgi:putative ABC transport system permease protein
MIRIAIKNLLHKPLNLLLSTVLFALGVALITALLLLNRQLGDQFEKNLAGIDLVIGAKGSPLQLILCNMYHIDAPTGNIPLSESRAFLNAKHPLIRNAVPLSLGDNYRQFRIVGTTPGFFLLYESAFSEGRLWQKDFEVVIGAAVAREAGMKIGDTFFSSHGFIEDESLVHDYTEPFKVVGILEPTGTVLDQLIACTSETVWKVHAHQEEEESDTAEVVAEIVFSGETDSLALANGHQEALTRLIAQEDMDITSVLVQFRGRNYQTLNMQRNINENTNLQAATPAIEINRLYSLLGVGLDALRMLAWVIMVVSGLSIFIALYNNLKERRYEMALMRAIGAGRFQLLFLIVMEGVILSLLGYIAGSLLGHASVEVLAGFMQDNYKYSLNGWVFLPEEGNVLVLSIVIGVAAAIIPAIQAYRTDIAKTLTHA